MRVLENGEKTEKLLSGFFLLEEEEQERFFDVLNALLFAKLRLEEVNENAFSIFGR